MKIIEPKVELINSPSYSGLLSLIELAGRTCYKSESKITEDSAEKFVRNILKRGHEAVIEHGNPIDDEIKALCEDVLTRWYAEKDGETDTGRVLPSDYLWFSGDGKHNYFRNAYKGGETWDWSLPSPYET